MACAPRPSQFPDLEATTSRQTAACASLSSAGGAAGILRDTSTTTVVASSSADFRPRFFNVTLLRIVDVYDGKGTRRFLSGPLQGFWSPYPACARFALGRFARVRTFD